jgi:hypothetical protein
MTVSLGMVNTLLINRPSFSGTKKNAAVFKRARVHAVKEAATLPD